MGYKDKVAHLTVPGQYHSPGTSRVLHGQEVSLQNAVSCVVPNNSFSYVTYRHFVYSLESASVESEVRDPVCQARSYISYLWQ